MIKRFKKMILVSAIVASMLSSVSYLVREARKEGVEKASIEQVLSFSVELGKLEEEIKNVERLVDLGEKTNDKKLALGFFKAALEELSKISLHGYVADFKKISGVTSTYDKRKDLENQFVALGKRIDFLEGSLQYKIALLSNAPKVEVKKSFDKSIIRTILANKNVINPIEQQMTVQCWRKNGKHLERGSRASGIVLSKTGLFVTSAHMIRHYLESKEYLCSVFSGEHKLLLRANIVAYSYVYDCALLQLVSIEGDPSVEEQLSDFKTISVSEEKEELYYSFLREEFGSKSYDRQPVERVSLNWGGSEAFGGYQKITEVYLFRFTRPVIPGDSGTPVFDKTGAIFGLISAVRADEAMIVPLKNFLKELIK